MHSPEHARRLIIEYPAFVSINDAFKYCEVKHLYQLCESSIICRYVLGQSMGGRLGPIRQPATVVNKKVVAKGHCRCCC